MGLLYSVQSLVRSLLGHTVNVQYIVYTNNLNILSHTNIHFVKAKKVNVVDENFKSNFFASKHNSTASTTGSKCYRKAKKSVQEANPMSFTAGRR